MLQHHLNETISNALNSLTSFHRQGRPQSSSLSSSIVYEPLCQELSNSPCNVSDFNVHSFLPPTAAVVAGINPEDCIITPKSQPAVFGSFSPISHCQIPYYKYSGSQLASILTETSEVDSATGASFPTSAISNLLVQSASSASEIPMNTDCNSYSEPIHLYSNSFFSNPPPPIGIGSHVDHERLIESGFGAYHPHHLQHPRNRRHLFGANQYGVRHQTSPQSAQPLLVSINNDNHLNEKKQKTPNKIVKRNRVGKRKRKLLTENRCSTKNNSGVANNFYSFNSVSQLRNSNNNSGDVVANSNTKKSYYQSKKDGTTDENQRVLEDEEEENEIDADEGPINDEDHSSELSMMMMLNEPESSDNEVSHGEILVGNKSILHEMDNTVPYDQPPAPPPHYYQHHYPLSNFSPPCVVAPVPPSSYPSAARHYQQYFNGTGAGGGSSSPMTATGASSLQSSSGTPPQPALSLSPSSPVTAATTPSHSHPVNSGQDNLSLCARSSSFDLDQPDQLHPHHHLSHHNSHPILHSSESGTHHTTSHPVNQNHCIKMDPNTVDSIKSHHPLELSSPTSPPILLPSLQFNDKVCYGCRQTLSTSPIIASVSGYHKWHINCLCCSECSQSLSQSRSCYIRNGRIYCKSDYIKLIKCSKCYRQISASDWVRRAGELVYHLACFACDLCQRQLSTGEKFTIEKQSPTESRLLCKLHFGIKNEEGTPTKHELNTSDLEHSSSSNAASNISNGSSGNLKSSTGHNQATTPTGGLGGQIRGGSMDNLSVRSSSGMSSSSKTKRVRTTFTEEQLSVLQANFQLDSNPDGQDLERIASLTGLSKRVTQVWFQNSRARQKKYMSRSQRHSGMLGQNGGSTTPPVSLLSNGGRSNGVGDLWSPSSSMCSSNTGLNSDNTSPMDTLSTGNGTLLESISINLPPSSSGSSGGGGGGGSTGSVSLSATVSSIAAAIAVSNGVNNSNGANNSSQNAPKKWASLGVIDHSTNASQYSESEHSSSPSTAHM